MKKILIPLLVFICISIKGQYQRFIYEYQYAIDSTNIDSTDKEIMYLDIAPKGSKYYSELVAKNDSISNAEFSKQIKMGGNVKFSKRSQTGKIRSVVEKSYPNYSVEFYDQMGMSNVIVTDDRPLNWQIHPEKMDIGEFHAQKATLKMYGRTWSAWFDPNIAIQDGPYKFHGLPGLIVKISSADGTHNFELIGVKKLSPNQEWTSTSSGRGRNTIRLNSQKYKKFFLDYRKDPNKDMKQMLSQRGTKIILSDEHGNPLDLKDLIQQREKRNFERVASQNNLLEKDLLQ